jgi:aryl-alcohol dehydrogenase-like predicted oxidoreductase
MGDRCLLGEGVGRRIVGYAALPWGVNFIDTADRYGDGRSEKPIAKFKKERKEEIIVATKAGRRLPKQTEARYRRKNLTN